MAAKKKVKPKEFARKSSREKFKLLKRRSKAFERARFKLVLQCTKFNVAMSLKTFRCNRRLRKILGRKAVKNPKKELSNLLSEVFSEPSSTKPVSKADAKKATELIDALTILKKHNLFAIKRHQQMIARFEEFERTVKELGFEVPKEVESIRKKEAKLFEHYENDLEGIQILLEKLKRFLAKLN